MDVWYVPVCLGNCFVLIRRTLKWMQETFTLAPSRVHVSTIRLVRHSHARLCVYTGYFVALISSFGTHVKVVMLKWRKLVRVGWEKFPGYTKDNDYIFLFNTSENGTLKIAEKRAIQIYRPISYHTQWHNSATCTTLTHSFEWMKRWRNILGDGAVFFFLGYMPLKKKRWACKLMQT